MANLTIDDLFTPVDADTWNQQLLDNAETLELKTTSWQSGGMARTILAISSNIYAQGDGIISIMAQGGFLDFAANGIVTYTAANGETVTQKVSPDPSVLGENPDGSTTWLDVLASSVYNEVRIGAQFASNDLAIANTTSNTYGPFAVGTYHVTNPTSGSGYSNTSSLTINPANLVGSGISAASNTNPIIITTNASHGLSGGETVLISGVLGNTAANGFWKIVVTSSNQFYLSGGIGNGAYTSGGTVNICTVQNFAADIAGPDGTSATGTITETVTVLSGVSVFNTESFVGANYESNNQLSARCRLKLQARSPNGPKGAYEYFALTAGLLLAKENPPVQLVTPATRVKGFLSVISGVRTTVVASASGEVEGVSNLAITNATNASPIAITTAAAHGLVTGDFVSITGVVGNTNANFTWNITVTGSNSFTLDDSSGNAAYIGGGIVQGGDLGQIDKIIQANAVPDNTTAITESAIGFDVAVIAEVEVPQSKVAIYTAAVNQSLTLYFASLAIGGISGFLEYENIIGVLFAAGQLNNQQSYVNKIVSLSLNGLSTDLAYPFNTSVARLSPLPVINVVGV